MKVCVDLFAGSGGFSHGWIQAGGRVAVAVDVWHEALQNHAFNHPQVPTLALELGGDIEETARILKEYLEPFGLDVHFHLHGSPPCQAFSNASSGLNASEGAFMVKWFLDLVAYMKPDSWSMENVLPVVRWLPEGTPWVKLCSADFGVPQKRHRVFAGEGWEANPSHSKETWVSVVEAIPDLSGCELLPAPSMSSRWKNLTINAPFPTITSQSPNQIRIKNSFQIRSLTVEETATIQGWPGMKFIEGLTKAKKRLMVGNMVSPPVAKAICEGIQ